MSNQEVILNATHKINDPDQVWLTRQYHHWCERHSWYKITEPVHIVIIPIFSPDGQLDRLLGHYPSVYLPRVRTLPEQGMNADWDQLLYQIIRQNSFSITGWDYTAKKEIWISSARQIWHEFQNAAIPYHYLAARLTAENLNAINE